MSSPWKVAGPARLAYSAGSFAGDAAAQPDSGATVTLGAPLAGVALGSELTIRYRAEDATVVHDCTPRLETGYIQQPYAVLPYALATPVGLRLTAFVRATADGVDVDFRLATVATLEEVVLGAELTWQAATRRELAIPTELRARTHASAGVSAAWLESSASKLLLLIDVGEHGSATPAESACKLEFFRQSLEKGVIMVGRIALRAPADDVGALATLADWLERPSASL